MSTNTNAQSDLVAAARLDDPKFYLGDPHPIYERLRREAPVYWCDSGQFWALSKHEDVTWAENQANPPLTATQGLFISEATQLDRIADRDPGGLQQSGASFMSDPPSLTQFRRLVGAAFTEKRVVGLADKVRSIASELLDPLPAGEQVESVDAFAVPLAIRVAGELLGVPREDWDRLGDWADAHRLLIGGAADTSPAAMEQAKQGELEMFEYFADAIDRRRAEPSEDLMSTIAALSTDSGDLSDQVRTMVCFAFFVAGSEATRNVLAGAMETFAQLPGEWERLVRDPSLLRSSTEELLRWVTPVLHFGRRATEPFELRGAQIKAGDFVVMLYESANRDEEVWPDADRFDIARPVDGRPHLSFGWGLHRCLGRSLGRIEIDTALAELAKRYRGWELAGPAVRAPSTVVKDYQRVPVVFSPR